MVEITEDDNIYKKTFQFLDCFNLSAIIDKSSGEQNLEISYLDENGKVIDYYRITCIHTALGQVSVDQMKALKESPDRQAEYLILRSSENLSTINLAIEDKIIAFTSWVQGIAEMGVNAFYIQQSIEELAKLAYPISKPLMIFVLKHDISYIFDYIQYIERNCFYNNQPHIPSIRANLLLLKHILNNESINVIGVNDNFIKRDLDKRSKQYILKALISSELPLSLISDVFSDEIDENFSIEWIYETGSLYDELLELCESILDDKVKLEDLLNPTRKNHNTGYIFFLQKFASEFGRGRTSTPPKKDPLFMALIKIVFLLTEHNDNREIKNSELIESIIHNPVAIYYKEFEHFIEHKDGDIRNLAAGNKNITRLDPELYQQLFFDDDFKVIKTLLKTTQKNKNTKIVSIRNFYRIIKKLENIDYIKRSVEKYYSYPRLKAALTRLVNRILDSAIKAHKRVIYSWKTPYFCTKCNRKHIRGNIYQEHIYYADIKKSDIIKKIPRLQFNLKTMITKTYSTRIVGAYYRGTERQLLRMKPGKLLNLKPEPDNPHDRNAIAVYDGFTHLGYIPRDDNEEVLELLDVCDYTAEFKHASTNPVHGYIDLHIYDDRLEIIADTLKEIYENLGIDIILNN